MARSCGLPVSSLASIALLLFILVATAHATPFPAVSLSPLVPVDFGPLAYRGVDDVGPAVTNATQAAIAEAQTILSRYSNVLRVVAIPTGLCVTFFGYFLLGPVLFLAAFVSGGGASFVAVHAALGDASPAAAWLAIAAMLLGGALLGFLALRALSVGMFAVGAALGVVLAAALKTSLIASAYPADPQLAFYVVAGVCGVLFGLLALCLQKPMLILSTSYAGSCAAVFGVGHFAGHFPTPEDLEKAEAGDLDGWVLFYILFALVLGTAGMLVQFWLGRNKAMPDHAPRDRRRRRRRVRQHDHGDWSDRDDAWSDDAYMEREPLPRRKRDPYMPREDIQTPLPADAESLKVELTAARDASYTQSRPWGTVSKMVDAVKEDSQEHGFDAVQLQPTANALTPVPQDCKVQIEQLSCLEGAFEVDTLAIQDHQLPGPPAIESETEREPEGTVKPEAYLQHSPQDSVFPHEAAALDLTTNSASARRAGVPTLVDASLGNDCEVPSVQQNC